MLDKPKISLIICSKDRAQRLKTCLQAISAEEMLQAKGELILVNNNSSDDTEDVMRCFQKKARFPVYIITEPRTGLSRARNAGLLNAQGEVIIFTDDDAYLSQGYLIKAATIFDSGEFDYCGGQTLLCDKEDAPIGICYFNKINFIEPYTFIPAGTISGINMIFSRKLINQVGYFDTMLGLGTPFPCEDIDYVARASWSGFRGVRIPDLIMYHHHGRKLHSKDAQDIYKAYTYGRGAYYMKFILRGKLTYLVNWYKISKYKKSRLKREIRAALKYLFVLIKKFLTNILNWPMRILFRF